MLKGKAEPVSAWRLISVLPEVPAFASPIATPFVGRRIELASLEGAFARAAADSRCEQVIVLGPPGIGKSRLMREAVAFLGDRARVVEAEVDTLVDALLGDRTFPGPARAKVLEATDGNSLFVEQLLALQAEDRGIDGELFVPPTLRALLAARIDRLEPADRAVIERAAVEGRSFHRGAVAELLPGAERAEVGARLLALVRKELIRPDRSDFTGDDGFRFAHMLIRERRVPIHAEGAPRRAPRALRGLARGEGRRPHS